ncbi:MAG: hypothetical protein KA761_12340 [Gemmatimonadaceae bacterium]|nr:hypothetical protein [Gemmatimonadaceae bacterium]
MRSLRALRSATLFIPALIACGCSFPTDPAGEVADVRGTWHYSGDQAAPALTLDGTLLISTQRDDVISGQLSWQEQGVAGGVRSDGGPVSGRVIEDSDVDFDVLLAATERRHVGRIVGDTIRGAWIEVSSGRSGNFVAVKAAP